MGLSLWLWTLIISEVKAIIIRIVALCCIPFSDFRSDSFTCSGSLLGKSVGYILEARIETEECSEYQESDFFFLKISNYGIGIKENLWC